MDEHHRVHGFRRGVQYSSASLVKAMLLVAYLDRRDVRHRRLRGGDRRLLGPMIRVSDNDAATAVYEIVGPAGLRRVAKRAGMRRFVTNPVWGGCQVTARDQARFFSRIRRLITERHRTYALGLLRRIVSYERWGSRTESPRAGASTSRAAGSRTTTAGGCTREPCSSGAAVHISIAVLTRGSPSLGYGAATIAGVTARLLRGYS